MPQTGDHLALPAAPAFAAAVSAGPPVVSFTQVSGAPIEMTDAFATETFTQTGGGPAVVRRPARRDRRDAG